MPQRTPRFAMKLRQKILLLAVAPLTIAMLAIMLTVRHQSIALARHERQLVESAYLQAKETELRSYVKLAQSAIAPLLASGQSGDPARDEATRDERDEREQAGDEADGKTGPDDAGRGPF
jgi:two-component system NarL family sensor kinase